MAESREFIDYWRGRMDPDDKPLGPAVEAQEFAWLRSRGYTPATIGGTTEEKRRYAEWLAANPVSPATADPAPPAPATKPKP